MTNFFLLSANVLMCPFLSPHLIMLLLFDVRIRTMFEFADIAAFLCERITSILRSQVLLFQQFRISFCRQ